jgi:NAD(P)-dependent dehydrogenase (short-subunit alcohol dehydrogenase family)
MKTVVITGSTRGIGFGLAESFLALDCAVTVSGRGTAGVTAATDRLTARYDAQRVLGHVCDVTDYEQVQGLWDAAQARFGQVDIWINNAGISHAPRNVWEQPPAVMRDVVSTNVIGALYGSAVALRGMMAQGFGGLYTLEGLGSDGRYVKGMAIYGSTKRALRYLDQALAQETRGTAVIVGALLPGMVATDMVIRQYEGRPEEWEKVKPMFNILSDRVETVTPWLARRVLENRKSGARISWNNGFKMLGRFLTAPFRKRTIFD